MASYKRTHPDLVRQAAAGADALATLSSLPIQLQHLAGLPDDEVPPGVNRGQLQEVRALMRRAGVPAGPSAKQQDQERIAFERQVRDYRSEKARFDDGTGVHPDWPWYERAERELPRRAPEPAALDRGVREQDAIEQRQWGPGSAFARQAEHIYRHSS